MENFQNNRLLWKSNGMAVIGPKSECRWQIGKKASASVRHVHSNLAARYGREWYYSTRCRGDGWMSGCVGMSTSAPLTV